ncbi:MAG TPA: ABC transporter ATP-binding protein [Ktedonobacterales bacterium]|jgi:ABC-type multidrug transport system ATPase subunit|nr:ABC transporter ATP-binding protein [Ktedonobacterales bacterium]
MASTAAVEAASDSNGAAERDALIARGISKRYGRRQVLQDISFELAAGSLVGIVGENGAGKSTLLRILAGELRPSAGEVSLNGALGYCPQAPVLNDALTVAQHLDYFRAAYHLADERWATELVQRLGYERYCATPVRALSGGSKQKLNLTIALMRDPAVLLLDEPYQGFDWETYLRFWDLASELRQRGRAVLIISHLVYDRSRFDKLYSLANGRLQLAPAQADARIEA